MSPMRSGGSTSGEGPQRPQRRASRLDGDLHLRSELRASCDVRVRDQSQAGLDAGSCEHPAQDVFAHCGLAAQSEHDAVQGVRFGSGDPVGLGNGREPLRHRARLTAFEDLAASREDQVHRALPRARVQQTLDRRGDVPVLHEPVRRRGDDADLVVGISGAEAVPQQVAEKMVEAEPLVMIVDRHEEHRVAFEFVEDRGGVVDLQDGFDEGGRHAVEDRESQQELAPLLGLGEQHLLAEVVGDQAIGPGEAFGEQLRIVLMSQADRGELDAGRPALGRVHHG